MPFVIAIVRITVLRVAIFGVALSDPAAFDVVIFGAVKLETINLIRRRSSGNRAVGLAATSPSPVPSSSLAFIEILSGFLLVVTFLVDIFPLQCR